MNKKTLNKIKDLLLNEKQELLNSSKLKNAEVDNDGDEIDEIQANLIVVLNDQLSIRSSEKIIKIDAALHKINNGKFGTCEDCEEDIPEKRLLINPYFPTCVDCAEERERK